MKHYIIYLPQYQNSVQWAQHAMSTGQALGWNVELFEGVDGRTVSEDADWHSWGVEINTDNAKCRAMMQRPGVRGCFLSHWQLWNLCKDNNQPLGIFEHDIEFVKPPPKDPQFRDVLKLEGFLKNKSKPAGAWYEGARAYILKPTGAKKLIDWVHKNGALPADVAIGLDVVDIELDTTERITPHPLYGKHIKRENSFTWNLESMERT